MKYTIEFPEDYVKPPFEGGKKWVEALRSGKYEQAKGVLKNDTGYCCLGVASEICGRLILDNYGSWCDGPSKTASDTGLEQDHPFHKTLGDCGFFPKSIHISGLTALTTCNDSGMSFNEIADIIEQVWDIS